MMEGPELRQPLHLRPVYPLQEPHWGRLTFEVVEGAALASEAAG